MTLLRTTRAEVASYALSLQGRSRDYLPVPWTADPGIDDCARFCSHVLWGGKPGPISWVDNFKSAGDGTYHAGADGLQPWDVILFDWEANGVGNHVEFLWADNGDTLRTYGANGADTKAATFRNRPRRYVLGYFRPNWSAAATPAPAKPKTRKHMYTIIPMTLDPKKPANAAYVCGPTGKRKAIASSYHRELLERYRDNDGSDTMLKAELDVVAGYLRKVGA